MNRKFICLQFLLAVFSILPLVSQEVATDSSYAVADTMETDFGLFTKSDVLELTLWFDITQYTRKKPKEE